ncbi:DNA-directed RNA polymerase subunit beta' [Striga asiatica]|uniref:DNA-directed RNA polymerase subunit beta n=1 Tax=Striga asiatica TaxID=4170 RepID=A0A5A7RG64_STRAF|nr:DNA-directed RNA polymerase subunit beta' [Striga asiatica]
MQTNPLKEAFVRTGTTMDYSCTQESGRSSSSQIARRRTWSRREESALIDILKDMVIEGWKADNGFRQGYNFEIEKRLKLKIPDCTLQAEPHISSKIHVWMKNYRSVALIKGTSGFGWSELTKNFSCDDKVWTQWVKVNYDTHSSWDSLNGIACRLGFEHEAEKKRNAVFDSLSNMHFLSKEDKMIVTMRLCKNQQELSMFFSLSMEDKAIMVKMMQDGRFSLFFFLFCCDYNQGMDNMDVDGDGPHFFKAVQFRTLHTMVR